MLARMRLSASRRRSIGEPGDVVLCHPLILHVAAQNASDTPRFMRSQRICVDARVEGGEHESACG
jgi:ectoine hydroxylase-related dioxygenase (phytanoyl-CoA dioxygenase family)